MSQLAYGESHIQNESREKKTTRMWESFGRCDVQDIHQMHACIRKEKKDCSVWKEHSVQVHLTMERARIYVICTYMYAWPARYGVHIHGKMAHLRTKLSAGQTRSEKGMSAKKLQRPGFYARESESVYLYISFYC